LVTDVPLAELLKTPEQYLPLQGCRTFIVCRLGNDSQVAARALREAFVTKHGLSGTDEGQLVHQVVDVTGGLRAWTRDVDPSFPIY
jgi:adenylyltransferase/sulfurtransferase